MTDTYTNLLSQHINQFMKFDYEVLLSIAHGKEPITYTFIAESKEHQIEINFLNYNAESLEMAVSIDSDWEARFASKGLTRAVTIQRV